MKKSNLFEIEIVNIKKTPAVKKDTSYVYCGRGSALGNPFNMENYSVEERNRVCDAYEEYIDAEVLTNEKIKLQLNLCWKTGRENGIVKLGCYCAPLRCHCNKIKDILIEKQEFLASKKAEIAKLEKEILDRNAKKI